MWKIQSSAQESRRVFGTFLFVEINIIIVFLERNKKSIVESHIFKPVDCPNNGTGISKVEGDNFEGDSFHGQRYA